MTDQGSDQHAPDPRRAETVTSETTAISSRVPERIGRYHIKRVIASGGMGTVYEATQDNPRRVVAVKVMKAGISSKSALRRFEYEGQILGRLRHPGIAQIYEAGTHDEGHGAVPYFAMEYIPNAKSITTFAEEKKLGTRQRMELFAKVCDAIHHGHQKGIIHRDLKPSNILVDSTGQVKIIDFGVARSTDSDLAVTTLQTDVGQLIGTLQYMSPEQCEGDPHDIDTRSDVYALGVVFYQLLCGKLPYDVTRMAMHQATRAIREQHPTKLSTLDKTLRGDVETIAFKALEKERERRYQSAADLGHDIHRYLTGEAIAARRASIVYQLRLFARRNKAVFGAMSITLIVLMGGLIGTSWGMVRANRAERFALQKSATAEHVSSFLASLLDEIDAVRMAGALRADLLDWYLRTREETELLDAAASRAEFARQLDRVNLVDVAQDVVQAQILGPAEERIRDQLKDEPEVAGRLLLTIGTACHWLNRQEDAERNLLLARTLLEQSRGLSDEWTMSVLDRLGSVYRRSGRYDEAARVYLELLGIKQGDHGISELSILDTANYLGDVYRYQGRNQEAETILGDTLVRLRRIGGDTHLSTLNTMNNLALVFTNQGRYRDSEDLLREALEGFAKTVGEDHRETINTTINLGDNLRKQGRLDEAESLYRHALLPARRILGNEHWITLNAIDNLAHALRNKSDYDEAERLYREALVMRRKLFGNEDTRVAQSLLDLAIVLEHQGKYPEAGLLLGHSLAMYRSLLGEEHPDVAKCLRHLATLLERRGEYEAAEESARASLRICETKLAPTDRQRFLGASVLGAALVGRGQFAESEPLLLGACEGLKDRHDVEPAYKQDAIERIVRLYDSWDAAEPGKGYAEKAAQWRAKLEETSKSQNAETSKP